MAIVNENDKRKAQTWIYPTTSQIGSSVKEVEIPEECTYVAIQVEENVNELEDFDRIDELIMYLVVFLRKIRRQFSQSNKR